MAKAVGVPAEIRDALAVLLGLPNLNNVKTVTLNFEGGAPITAFVVMHVEREHLMPLLNAMTDVGTVEIHRVIDAIDPSPSVDST
jgi:hypothetical protein